VLGETGRASAGKGWVNEEGRIRKLPGHDHDLERGLREEPPEAREGGS
jgi:hypothetical protein